jgi:hypothetical protein
MEEAYNKDYREYARKANKLESVLDDLEQFCATLR